MSVTYETVRSVGLVNLGDRGGTYETVRSVGHRCDRLAIRCDRLAKTMSDLKCATSCHVCFYSKPSLQTMRGSAKFCKLNATVVAFQVCIQLSQVKYSVFDL